MVVEQEMPPRLNDRSYRRIGVSPSRPEGGPRTPRKGDARSYANPGLPARLAGGAEERMPGLGPTSFP